MNNEQNIDDILKLLKSSYGEEESPMATDAADGDDDSGQAISHEELQDRLKRQFMSGESGETSASEDKDDFSYALDDTILAEAESEQGVEETFEESEKEEIPEEESVIFAETEKDEEEDDGIPPFDLAPENENSFEESEAEHSLDEGEIEEIDTVLELVAAAEETPADELVAELDDDGLFEEDDEIFVENEDGEIVLVKAENYENTPDTEDIAEEYAEEDGVVEEAVSEEDSIELFSDESGQLAIFDMAEETVSYEEENADSEKDAEDTLQIAMDFGESCSEETEYSEMSADSVGAASPQIDDAMLGLMLEFGDVSAVEASVGSERVDDYINKAKKESSAQIDSSEAFAFDGNEYEAAEQREELMYAYSREKLFTGLRVLGCAVFTVLLFIYELVSALDIEMAFIPDYVDYPAVYMLVGMQLLVFSAAFAWRELWSGLKKAFSFKPDKWSFVSLMCVFSFVYGAVAAVTSSAQVLYTFGTAASLYILLGLIFEFTEVCREIKCFEIYSSEQTKFTVSTNPTAGSCAEKMYRGGVSRESKIFEPRKVDFPRGYFSAVNLSGETDKLITYSVTPAIIMAAVALVVCAMLGSSAEVSMAAFMIFLAALCPISAFAIHTLPMYKVSSYLHRRGSAVAGEVMAGKYAECDYMVFADMHLFKSASAEDNGIVIYDEKNAAAVVGYLDALYGAIGGPMSGVFGGVSGGKHTVKLRRIAKNGVEAALDGGHSLILGDAEFCKRYGIAFEGMENTREGDGILGFAVDGRPAAKLCCRYRCEPIFEMLIEKMGENGIRCAIETYDPAINSAFAAACRKSKVNPVNVIHKNAVDYYSKEERSADENTGFVVCASRLKLVEGIIWCKRLRKTQRICSLFQWVIYGLICAGLIALVAFDLIGGINQYYILLVQALTMLPTLALTLFGFPKKDYFSL